jgi:cell division protein ZapA (FtsZ GTPase activity inhibitor)
MARSVSVQVAGQTLNIRTGASDAELEALTALIDQRVGEIRSAAPKAKTDHVLALTALGLADELRQLTLEFERFRATVTEEAQGALQFLDEDDERG